MGLDVNGARFILYARTLGVEFTRTAMIGRQGLHLSPLELRASLQRFGFSFDDALIERVFSENGGYAERFFRSLGAQEVHSFDHSDYEGATHTYDLNQNIPEQFKRQYSVVLDGGSLEHVFNFPIAMKNCMEMVQVGGHYLGIAPANNLMGHGFYQFSPELFHSVFTPGNGYELLRLIAFEDRPKAEWYLVKSPASIRQRVTLTNRRAVYLVIVARRTADLEPLRSMPQQSDYVGAWKGVDAPVRRRTLLKRLFRAFDRRFFQSMDPTDGARSADQVLR